MLAADTVIASDVLERLSNEEAIKARKVIGQLKLSQEEMAEGLLPQVGGKGVGGGRAGGHWGGGGNG